MNLAILFQKNDQYLVSEKLSFRNLHCFFLHPNDCCINNWKFIVKMFECVCSVGIKNRYKKSLLCQSSDYICQYVLL